jgi:hypothetical protein
MRNDKAENNTLPSSSSQNISSQFSNQATSDKNNCRNPTPPTDDEAPEGDDGIINSDQHVGRNITSCVVAILHSSEGREEEQPLLPDGYLEPFEDEEITIRRSLGLENTHINYRSLPG